MAEPVKTEKGLGVAVVCLLIGLASCKSSPNVSFQKAVEMTMESQEQLKRDLGKMDEFNRRIAQQKQTNSTLLQIVESLNRRLGNESSIVRNMGQPISRK